MPDFIEFSARLFKEPCFKHILFEVVDGGEEVFD